MRFISEYEEIELLVKGQTPILVHKKSKKSVKSSRDNSQSSQRDSFPPGAGCLPCTPKSRKKNLEKILEQICKHGLSSGSSNWCCKL